MQIGRRLYFDKTTGNILVDTGERTGSVYETTQEEDFQAYKILYERNPETVGAVQLEYGQYTQDFAACDSYRINPETLAVEFSYPDPSQPKPQEPVYQRPLSEEVANLKQAIAELTMLIATP
jgi:hypothetical protein